MKAPFPWFGGKRRVAHIVWERFGDPYNFVEPFAGSLAVLLERPNMPRCETVNDKDCYLSNFWRAIQKDPEAVAHYADWPVNEADLHARHQWLSSQTEFRATMMVDPDFYDVRIAGWWVWGLSMWIGGGWCAESSKLRGRDRADGTARRGRPYLKSTSQAEFTAQFRKPGIKDAGVHAHWKKRPLMKRGGTGVQRTRPSTTGNGVHPQGLWQPVPDISGESGAYGRGIHACGLEGKTGGLIPYFESLAIRLRRVRVCCGDWLRIMGYSPTTAVGLTAVLLDPPYAHTTGRDADIYREEHGTISADVRAWAIEHGDDPLFRIALCGYDTEHEMPGTWDCVSWQPNGGYANISKGETQSKANKSRERIWFSPHCLKPMQQELFNEPTHHAQ